MKLLCSIPLVFAATLLFGQKMATDDLAVSMQYGPETGISLFFPKVALRTPTEGGYFGGFVSVNLVGRAAISLGAIGGYRLGGLATELSLSGTFVSGKHDGGQVPRGFWLSCNPKVLLGHKAFIGFGPGFYLVKPRKLTNSLWDDAGKLNFELGYSELFRF